MYELAETGFTTITQEQIRTYIEKAKRRVVYAKPAFYEVELQTLMAAAARGVLCDRPESNLN